MTAVRPGSSPTATIAPALAISAVAGYGVTLVPHTHWDREWYLPFEVFRMRLARTVEEVCDILEADPRFTRFTLDGQAIILDDVIELRPDLEPRLRRLLADGRLVTGPAYVLPDEFLASGEALVRNLLVGRAVCARYGARPMAVGYMPDPFGHVEQLPQILRGFGLEAFIFWRGLGDDANRVGLAFSWQAPDGSEVTAVRQLGSYGNACEIGRWAAGGVDLAERPDRRPEVAAARLVRYVTTFAVELERTGSRELFLCNGADHERIQVDLPDLIEHAREVHPATEIRIGSYEDYWRRLQPTLDDLPVIAGELSGGRDAPVLRGINSARIHLKQAAERAARALGAAETLASLALLAGRAPYPAAELGRAWRELLKNLPHDSISGCSVDETHRDMAGRFAAVEQIAERLRREALASLAGEVEPWSYRPRRSPQVSVVNVLPHARRAIAAIPLPVDLLDAPSLVVLRADGRPRAAQIAARGEEAVALVAVDLAGWGSEEVTITPGTAAAPVDRAAAIGDDAITNGILSLVAHSDGSITLTDERTGWVQFGLHRLEDVADRGDEYTFCPVEFDRPRFASSGGKVRVTASGPLLAELEVSLVLRLPERLSEDRRRRVGEVAMPVVVRIRLAAGSDRVQFTTTVDNRASDHRLRVRFPARGADEASTVRAEGHFSVVRRPVRPMWSGAGWTEPPALTNHTSGFVASGELALFGRGLPEYEAVPTADGIDLALTLLRCVGWLSRDDLATRPGGAGPSLETPEAQCPGRHTFEYALALSGREADLELVRRSADYRSPIVVGPAGVDLTGILAVDGDVAVSALKGAEDGSGAVVRLFALDRPARPKVDASAVLRRVMLDESPSDGDPLAEMRPGEIRTIRLIP